MKEESPRFLEGYVCISSRGPPLPLDLELYSRVSQKGIRIFRRSSSFHTYMRGLRWLFDESLHFLGGSVWPLSRRAAAGRAELLAKSAHAGHLRLPAELLEVAENSGNSKGSEFGISEKCCILEKSRKNLVKFGENSATLWQKLRNFGKKQQKIQQFLTKILRLESGAKECIV